MPQPASRQPQSRQRKKYWSHKLYRSPTGEAVMVHYCTTLAESEAVARRFERDRVLGFDMEWWWKAAKMRNFTIKANVSLIQVANEREIGLFHVALHPGTTTAILLAPTLRRIIESESVIKTGVAINSADAARLRRFMKLTPRGLVELGDMQHALNHARTQADDGQDAAAAGVRRSLKSLVQQHLGLPLFKGDVRTSDWTKPLVGPQVDYAASDAYAGIMVFLAQNQKRLAMCPVPALPRFAERGGPLDAGSASTASATTGSGAQPDRPSLSAAEPRIGQRRPLSDAAASPPSRPLRPYTRSPTFHQPQPQPQPAPSSAPTTLLAALHATRDALAAHQPDAPAAATPDTTLAALAATRPRTLPAMIAIPGALQFAGQLRAAGGASLAELIAAHAA